MLYTPYSVTTWLGSYIVKISANHTQVGERLDFPEYQDCGI